MFPVGAGLLLMRELRSRGVVTGRSSWVGGLHARVVSRWQQRRIVYFTHSSKIWSQNNY